MKVFLCLVVLLAFATSQLEGKKLKVTVYYETLCGDSRKFFRTQLGPAYQDQTIRENIQVELVPFGKASFTENPWKIECQHGPKECEGNAVHACFFAKNPENKKQVNFATCTMSTDNPPEAAEECAKKLNYQWNGVEKCAAGDEGRKLQIKHGKKTMSLKPKLKFVPTIVFNDVYNEKDQQASLTNFKQVVIDKLLL